MHRSYKEALHYLYDNLPVFQRVGAIAFKKDITNTVILCEALGNPHQKFKSIHVAGTNGKGSTSHMLASILQSAGYKTGLYTSPHLKAFTERIKINGQEISEEFVVDFVNRVQPLIDEVKPSFFEITVAMAFDYFARQQVDIAVVEVGLGGRLDSTNVITPELSLITNIGWDHKDLLGDTLEKIAFEKAGIIKQHVPAVISERQQHIDQVFQKKASEVSAPLDFASDQYEIFQREERGEILLDVRENGVLYLQDLHLPLQGFYQRKNLGGVLKAVEILQQQGWAIGTEKLRHGLEHVIFQTGLKGRWQKLGERPFVVCDTGHNADGIKEVVQQIKAQHYKKLHVVWGSVKDKDLAEILSLLPAEATYYFCQAKIPRAMNADQLAGLAQSYGLKGKVIPDVNEAVQEAKMSASQDDMIFIGGSTFVVAEIDNL